MRLSIQVVNFGFHPRISAEGNLDWLWKFSAIRQAPKVRFAVANASFLEAFVINQSRHVGSVPGRRPFVRTEI
jgi:hypothetical protein